ncbi:hypothetical protein [Actinosynnema sp. NPDC020468]
MSNPFEDENGRGPVPVDENRHPLAENRTDIRPASPLAARTE